MEVKEASARYLPPQDPDCPHGYKLTEVGVIPEDWNVVCLDNVLNGYQNGYAFSAKGYVSSGVPIITMAQIGLDGRFNFNEDTVNKWPISEYEKLKTFLVKDGDVIISMTDVTPEKNLIGRMAVVDLENPALLNQRVGILRLNNKLINPVYLVSLSNQAKWRNYSKSVASLGVQANIGTTEIKKGLIPLPPTKAEQEAIAGALSDTDALIESLEQLIAKKRHIKQGAMQELLTGKRRLPGFNVEWKVQKLGGSGQFLKGSGVKKDETLSGNLPCIRYGEIYTHHNDYIRSFYSWVSPKVAATATPIRYGDILFTGSGETKEDIGKCVAFVDKVEAYAGGDIVILRTANADPLFLGYYLNTATINRQKASVM